MIGLTGNCNFPCGSRRDELLLCPLVVFSSVLLMKHSFCVRMFSLGYLLR